MKAYAMKLPPTPAPRYMPGDVARSWTEDYGENIPIVRLRAVVVKQYPHFLLCRVEASRIDGWEPLYNECF